SNTPAGSPARSARHRKEEKMLSYEDTGFSPVLKDGPGSEDLMKKAFDWLDAMCYTQEKPVDKTDEFIGVKMLMETCNAPEPLMLVALLASPVILHSDPVRMTEKFGPRVSMILERVSEIF